MLTEYQKYRMYEILPGVTVWGTLIAAVVLSFTQPLWMIYAVILFDIYWVIRVINFSFYLTIAWLRFYRVRQIDWKDTMRHELTNWQEKHHVVFLTLYKEEWPVVKTSLESLVDAVYDKEKFVIVIAGEERAKEQYEGILAQAKEEFGDKFFDIVGTLHPKDLTGEIPGKGSNLHYAERQMKKYIDKKQWKHEKVIATIFDIDTICHIQYFAYLTYLYCTHPTPTRTSFQPIALYNNNIWDSPAPLRIMSFGTTFWTFTSLARQDALVTFSSHSMSWKAIVDVGFHEKRIVSEDSRIFYQCFLHYNGDYRVTPMYLPVSMDTVRDDSWWVSIKNLYKQQRRWAWGTEHIPYLITEFKKKGKLIPLWKKAKWVFFEWEGKWSWACVALLITVLGQLPMRIAPASVRQSALFFNTPHLLQILMTMALLGMVTSAIFSFPLLPKRPESHPRHKYIIMLLQWLLLPITMILVSAIPAIDAVTHLMFGKYLGFNVSQKKRKL
ncbi:MAG: hypothetical protein HOE80_03605 [Candidatus Magasanikbacteria bacterium]|jgi:hypothetical protein|nr:hypothetical protein [Candidatus Magasanikbacteria bacterium]MBT4071782.1 hypothetical protein [Candidatus Magasanikbacteria bacterium]